MGVRLDPVASSGSPTSPHDARPRAPVTGTENPARVSVRLPRGPDTGHTTGGVSDTGRHAGTRALGVQRGADHVELVASATTAVLHVAVFNQPRQDFVGPACLESGAGTQLALGAARL